MKMSSLLLKIEEWIIDKEEKLAKGGKIDLHLIDKQIDTLLLYKRNLKSKCNQQTKDLEYLIDKLHWVKAYSLKCEELKRKELENKY